MDGPALVAHGFEIASFVPPDSLSPPLSETAFANLSFRFTKPFRESESASITHIIGGWTYDLETQSLRVAIPTSGWRQAELPRAEADDFMHYGLTIGSRNLSDRMEKAQNAYGAEFEVHSLESQTVQVAPLTRRERAASVDIRSEMFADLKMTPAEAREAVTGAEVIVEGILVPLAGDQMTLCRDTGSRATIDLRLSTLIRICVMNARITRVAIVSGEGATLVEWLPRS